MQKLWKAYLMKTFCGVIRRQPNRELTAVFGIIGLPQKLSFFASVLRVIHTDGRKAKLFFHVCHLVPDVYGYLTNFNLVIDVNKNAVVPHADKATDTLVVNALCSVAKLLKLSHSTIRNHRTFT